jgi:hypothetical protein
LRHRREKERGLAERALKLLSAEKNKEGLPSAHPRSPKIVLGESTRK